MHVFVAELCIFEFPSTRVDYKSTSANVLIRKGDLGNLFRFHASMQCCLTINMRQNAFRQISQKFLSGY